MVDEAITSTPEKEETTPQGSKEAATSGKPTEGEVPSEQVVQLQAEVDRLTKLAKQSQDLQRQSDKKARIEKIERQKLEKQLQRIKAGEEYIPPEIPEGETPVEREVRSEARIGIQNLILENPEYQELLKQDITLREVLRNNPFALIGEYFDAQDAVEQIREKLDGRVSTLKSQPKVEKKEGEPVKFEAGAIQPPETMPPTPPKPATPETLDKKLEEGILRKIKFE